MFWKKKTSEKEPENDDLHAVAVTNTGCTRAHNEDSVRFVQPSASVIKKRMGCLAIVADGMGGHASGEVASSIAVETIASEYYQSKRTPVKALEEAARLANEKIWSRAVQYQALKGMGTTCTAVAIAGRRLSVLHIGDSRAYLLKKERLIQLSEDHTYVQELVRLGKITPEQATDHPDGNILTKSLGTAPKRECDIFQAAQQFEPGDKLMLCSDGLYEYFSTDELAVLLQQKDLAEISEQLSSMVLEFGAHDNFSLLLVEYRRELAIDNMPTRAIITEQ
ncbi:MAG: Stp1/IreP family PP2C-type Ser/Thr phosphatase [Balneolaceae bacterium]|nr:Stp1/IreP family PP2C-type Ser/Thr phosphatase [Balneolaceae bacterium]